MASLPTMTGAGGMIRLRGTLYACSQLPIGAIGEIQAWVSQQIPGPWEMLKDAMQSLQGLPESELAAIRNILVPSAQSDAKAGVVDLRSPEAIARLSSVEGMALVLWLSIKKHQPNMTLDMVHQEIVECEPEEAAALMADMERIIESSLGAEELAKIKEERQIKNPTIPPVPIGMPAEQTGIELLNKTGPSFTLDSSKMPPSPRRRFPK